MFKLVPSGRLQVVDSNEAAPVSESAVVPADIHGIVSTTVHSYTNLNTGGQRSLDGAAREVELSYHTSQAFRLRVGLYR